ncbi:MAG TPA: hypothetical protein VFF95_05635 [Candidatus Binatus sp.]|jgi:hypothetical protein|nr:hypothetical protein [Candidatus Binatus sp.]
MKPEEIAGELMRLTADYRHVCDGGYALVRGIREWARTLDPESRQILWDRLFESVANQDPTVWGVAVEVLVEEHPDGIAERLDDLLTRQNASEEWRDEIVFSLLRLGYRPGAVKYMSHIKEGLLTGKDGVLRLLAASCRIDPEECIALSSGFFGRALRAEGSEDEYRSIVPTFVRHFLDVDERFLGKLVERTKTVNIDAAKLLAALLDEYFTRPWNVRELGEVRAETLREQIGGSQSDLKSTYPH